MSLDRLPGREPGEGIPWWAVWLVVALVGLLAAGMLHDPEPGRADRGPAGGGEKSEGAPVSARAPSGSPDVVFDSRDPVRPDTRGRP